MAKKILDYFEMKAFEDKKKKKTEKSKLNLLWKTNETLWKELPYFTPPPLLHKRRKNNYNGL